MANQINTPLTQYIERARKVLQHEQRTHHQDQAVKPGGLEPFVMRWADELSTIGKNGELDRRLLTHFTEHIEGYRLQDPLQRAANLRAALALLTELENGNHPASQPSQESEQKEEHERAALASKPGVSSQASSPDSGQTPSSDIRREIADNGHEKAVPRATTASSRPTRAPKDGKEPTSKAALLASAAPPVLHNPIHLDAHMSTGHTALALLSADITAVPGVGPTAATRLHSLGIHTIRDLLFYFPRDHRDYSKLEKIANLPFNTVTTTMGLIWEVTNKRISGGRTVTMATISDDTGRLNVSWFNQPYLQKQLGGAKGSYLVVTGVKQRFGNKVEFSVRSHELPEQGDLLNTGRLVPTYPLTEGLHAKTLRRFTKWTVDHYAAMVPEHLPASIRFAAKLLPLPDAVSHIHYPESEEALIAARRRLAFDELFLIQLGMQERRSRWQQEAPQGNAFSVNPAQVLIDAPVHGRGAPCGYPTLADAGEYSTTLAPPDAGEYPTPTTPTTLAPPDAGEYPTPTTPTTLAPPNAGEYSTPTTPTTLAPPDAGGYPIPPPNQPLSDSPLGSTLWSSLTPSEPFEATLPFHFTEAQQRVIGEILGDLAQSRPMCRLLQGDVGSGKTAVAAAALFVAAINGYQGAIMAPTELLAEQHAQSISAMLAPFGIRTVLLTGSLRQRERTLGRAAIENGEAMVAIGTHALIQDEVNFQRLGLVVVDEQHRFGVEQRDLLRQKGYHPHMLVMTATPIPRTLALTLYGDLDVSVIDQLPPGRQKVITRWRTGARRSESNTVIAHQIAEGRQAFVICPLIDESESLAVKAATVEYERLRREVFPNLRLGLLHGAMKPTEKDTIMRSFRDGALDVLVATSVIEVGIDVPNASVMVIEDADRFGLSQLHQFRGRVGRGKHQSFCYVLSADASIAAQERLEVFQNTDDGFRLAEEDLRLRGPGDFFGVRQSGLPELRVANLSDVPLIELARAMAGKLWESDPGLHKVEHAPLRERLHLFWQHFMAH